MLEFATTHVKKLLRILSILTFTSVDFKNGN
jgi:hypothetical protein